MSKIGSVINTNDPETVWNALRFGLTALAEGHKARIFLMGKGVEIEDIDDPKFDVMKVLDDFLDNGGEMEACGVCLELREKEEVPCPPSTMTNLVKIVDESDKVVVFG